MSDPQDFSTSAHPHRRHNPLSGEWSLVSPQRTQRPWLGKVGPPPVPGNEYDPGCYLCPGNERAGGVRNPRYTDTFVFRNDFPALLDGTPPFELSDELHRLESVRGECRVTCFSPRHDLTLARMDVPQVRTVIDLWASQQRELEERWRWVQVFESQGAMVGASNPHPHGQVWAGDFLPAEVAKEDANQLRYFREHGSPMLVDYARSEERSGERVVVQNDHWLVVVPFWAYWPYETLVLPKRAVQRLSDLSDTERDALAGALKSMLVRFDNLFQTPFPYCSGWHGAPAPAFVPAPGASAPAASAPGSADAPGPAGAHGESTDHWQLHAHYYPPLLRSATVQKFVASYEWLAEAQRDITPEEAAARLRAQDERHYLDVAP